MRGLLETVNPPMVTVLLWSILRWEEKVALAALKHMAVDVHGLEDKVDQLLRDAFKVEEVAASRARPKCSEAEWQALLDPLLDGVHAEARKAGQGFVTDEHLLFAITRTSDSSLAALLARHKIHYEVVKEAIIEVCKPQDDPN